MKDKFFIGLTVGAQLLGQLLLQLVVVKQLGVGKVTDTLVASQTIPLILFAITSTAIQSIWLPKLSILIENIDELKRQQSIAQGQALIVGLLVLTVFGFTSVYWVSWIFPGFEVHQYNLIILFNWFYLLSVIFNLQSTLLVVLLRVKGKFLLVEIISLLMIVVSLITVYFLLPIYGVYSVIFVTLLRAILIYIFQTRIADSLKCDFVQGFLDKESWSKMLPLLLGTSIYKTSSVFDRYFASQATSGSMTILNLAQTSIYGFSTIFERSFITPILPNISRYIKIKNYFAVRKILRVNLIRTAFLILFMSIILFLIKPLFITFASNYLNLTIEHAYVFLILFFCFLGFLHSAIFTTLLVNTYYAIGDTKTPVYVGVLGFVFGVSLKFYLFKLIGVYALPVATSVYTILNNVFFYLDLDLRLKRLIVNNEK
jgi:putative peptidoglycan lipid II flippase